MAAFLYCVRGNIYDTKELAFGYYTIMEFDHSEFENWKRYASVSIERDRQPIQLPSSFSKQAYTASVKTSAASNKVGRNDPCPCGNGKKYKKCHGK